MYYFWWPVLLCYRFQQRRQPVCSQARRARISTVSTIFAHHTKKAACVGADSLAYSHRLANKAGSGYLLLSLSVFLDRKEEEKLLQARVLSLSFYKKASEGFHRRESFEVVFPIITLLEKVDHPSFVFLISI